MRERLEHTDKRSRSALHPPGIPRGKNSGRQEVCSENEKNNHQSSHVQRLLCANGVLHRRRSGKNILQEDLNHGTPTKAETVKLLKTTRWIRKYWDPAISEILLQWSKQMRTGVACSHEGDADGRLWEVGGLEEQPLLCGEVGGEGV